MSSDHQKKEGDDDNGDNRLVHALYNKLHIMAVFFFLLTLLSFYLKIKPRKDIFRSHDN